MVTMNSTEGRCWNAVWCCRAMAICSRQQIKIHHLPSETHHTSIRARTVLWMYSLRLHKIDRDVMSTAWDSASDGNHTGIIAAWSTSNGTSGSADPPCAVINWNSESDQYRASRTRADYDSRCSLIIAAFETSPFFQILFIKKRRLSRLLDINLLNWSIAMRNWKCYLDYGDLSARESMIIIHRCHQPWIRLRSGSMHEKWWRLLASTGISCSFGQQSALLNIRKHKWGQRNFLRTKVYHDIHCWCQAVIAYILDRESMESSDFLKTSQNNWRMHKGTFEKHGIAWCKMASGNESTSLFRPVAWGFRCISKAHTTLLSNPGYDEMHSTSRMKVRFSWSSASKRILQSQLTWFYDKSNST